MTSTTPSNRLGMASQLAQNVLRIGWYTAVHRFADRLVARDVPSPKIEIQHPVPSFRVLLADLLEFARKDAARVRDGLYPPQEFLTQTPRTYFGRVAGMLRDMPEAARRRSENTTRSVREVAEWEGLPEYYTQDFHFQDGGHLTETSARLYDVQVETLFNGSAALMRRAGLAPIGQYLRARDQRTVQLADVACGTGRFLRELRLAFPMLKLMGVDLSPAYLAEAEHYLAGLRPVDLVRGNVEALPLEDASQDIVTAIFLFHELPPDVRRVVAAEVFRVLKPGGMFVFIDSLQFGDRPGWDGLLESFPARFHEPYYAHYCIDDLDGMFTKAGLVGREEELAFVSKMMVRGKAE
jgi:ubiquinone/menaquinone biosynthesis C-methylase UbiE